MSTAATGTVVVANADDDAREVVARVVEGAGFDVVRVSSGGEVPAAAGSAVAVVADLGADGLDVVRTLRSAGGAAGEVPVLVVGTGPAGGRLALQAGADGFLVRPFHARDLQAAVRDAVARPDAERAAWRTDAAAAL